MEKEKDYILMKVTNSLKKHAELIEGTKLFVEVFNTYLFNV